MANQAVNFYLPPGRMVGGSTHEPQTKDMQGRDRDKPALYIAVAVPKTDPRVNDILVIIRNAALSFYANNPTIKAQIDMGLAAHNFAWKVSDGDSEKERTRPGRAGCWIFHFSTSFESIQCGDSQNNQIDPKLIKPGYYIDVSASVKANELLDKNAGVFLNPRGVRLLGYGEEIPIGQTIGQMFADVPAALPPGASALPVATGNPLGHGPVTGGQPAGTPPAPGFAGGMTPPPSPSAPPPPPPAGLGAPAAPVAPVMTVEQIQAQSAALAAQAGVQHYPGHRIKPDRSGYDPDPTPASLGAPAAAASPIPPASPMSPPPSGSSPLGAGQPVTHTPGVGGATSASPSNPMAAGAPAPGVPAGATPLAPSTGPNGFPATASPSNPPTGVQPHPGFLQPPAQKSPDEISAEIAAGLGVQHYPGFRCRPDKSGYDPNPAA